ncbi:MAG TPA: hypothetical protein VK485_10030, partial [Sphingomicrobium sp.]|nr:hypothetical protein [Sphingomicrobium sp.]
MISSRLVECRALLMAASSLAVFAASAPAQAQVASVSGSGPTSSLDIVTNDTVTPGTGSAATGANYANSAQVLSTG